MADVIFSNITCVVFICTWLTSKMAKCYVLARLTAAYWLRQSPAASPHSLRTLFIRFVTSAISGRYLTLFSSLNSR